MLQPQRPRSTEEQPNRSAKAPSPRGLCAGFRSHRRCGKFCGYFRETPRIQPQFSACQHLSASDKTRNSLFLNGRSPDRPPGGTRSASSRQFCAFCPVSTAEDEFPVTKNTEGQEFGTAFAGQFWLSSPTRKTARKASCGMSTLPIRFMRFLPSFCFSSSLRLREMSPP